MTKTRWMRSLCLLAGLLAATALSAKGLKDGEEQQLWMDFWKELNLQPTYTVDMEVQAVGMTMAGKIYRLDSRTRTEMIMPLLNMRMALLQLEENGKSVSYTLSPSQKKYCVNGASDIAAPKMPSFKITDQGTERFENELCTKRRLTITLNDGTTQDLDMLFSPAQKNMPVKITANVKTSSEPDRAPVTVTSVTLFKNYRFTAPDAALFVVPKDYTKAANMQEIMLGALSGFSTSSAQKEETRTAGESDLNAIIREAQAEAAKEAQSGTEKDTDEKDAARAQNIQQGLRSLFGN